MGQRRGRINLILYPPGNPDIVLFPPQNECHVTTTGLQGVPIPAVKRHCWGGGGGWEAQEGGGIRTLIAECCTEEINQHCKAIILQLKKESLF